MDKNDVTVCRLIELSQISNKTGKITIAEADHNIPFLIKRVYFLHEIGENNVRGNHAHKELEQVIVAIAGSFTINIDDGKNYKEINLESPSQGLYLCPGIWRKIYNFSKDAICMVMCSEIYDELDYIRNYDSFLEYYKQSQK